MKGDEKDGIKEKGIRQGNDRGVWLGGAFGIDQHYFFGCFMDGLVEFGAYSYAEIVDVSLIVFYNFICRILI